MALKSTLESAKARLNALLTYANETTGASDTSIGHPVTEISNVRWRYGSHAMVLNVTIYVDYSSAADIPTTITQNAQGDNVYAPSGSVVNIIYRNSTTGEILS